MKIRLLKTLVAVASLLSGSFVAAQEFNGVVTYQVKHLGKAIGQEDIKDLPDEIKKIINEKQKDNCQSYQLTFDKNASLYEPAAITQEKEVREGNITYKSSVSVPQTKIYRNLNEKKQLSEQDIFDKKFLVSGTTAVQDWTLTQETKKIGSYTAYKAIKPVPSFTTSINGKEVHTPESTLIAWYTQEIPVAHGPDIYYGLPGLILEVETGHQSIVCSRIVVNPKNTSEIKVPAKGKKVTNEEFNRIQKEKLEQFMKESDGKRVKIQYEVTSP